MATSNEHATGKTRRKTPTDRINVDRLAAMFGLPSWDDVDERNLDYYAECAHAAANAGADSDSPDALDAYDAATQEAQSEVWAKWHGGVMSAAESLFGSHGLVLVGVPVKGKLDPHPYEWRIVPRMTWENAANWIRETINGVGVFHFATLREFLDYGPYTARHAVLAHLGAIASYPEVYGTTSARRLYEGSWS